MAKVHSMSASEGVVTVCFHKPPSAADIRRAISEVAERFPGLARLWDFRSVRVDLAPGEIQQLANFAKSQATLPSRVAIVVPDDASFGLSRMYEVYREDDVSEHMVFRSEEEARDWLRR